MKKKKVLVFSNFGYQTGVIGGQTIKIKHIYRLLSAKQTEQCFDLNYFDTDSFSNKKLLPIYLFRFFMLLIKSTNIVFVGSKNNLLFFFPIIYFVGRVFKKQIDYIVVGGWLADFLVKHPRYRKPLASINGIYPQTKELCISLKEDFDFKNVQQLHNFKFTNQNQSQDLQIRGSGLLKLVFLARVSKQKGVDTLFLLAKKIEELGLDVLIDIYGPLDTNYQSEFYEHLSRKPSLIEYKGAVEPDEVHSILGGYDLMLFPTIYIGEGFPGSVLDAYISGIPVMASKWRYATEFIEDGKTGILSDFGNADDFVQKTISLLENPNKLIQLTQNAKKESEKYSPEEAWKVLKNYMFKSE